MAPIHAHLPPQLRSLIPTRFPPALTTGLPIFLTFLYLLNFILPVNDSISLAPVDVFNFDLNRLSFYSMGHLSFFHLLFNIMSLITPLGNFEKRNGTVRTGVVLNLLTVTTGLIYSLIGYFLYPETKVLGASALVFSFLGWFAYNESLITPTYTITPTVIIPTIYTPVIPLILVAILVPGSSFLGHLYGLLMGYALALGYLNVLVPKSSIIEWIEVKCTPAINLIPSFVKYYREEDAKYVREGEYSSVVNEGVVSIGGQPLVEEASEQTEMFPGRGHVLGV